MSGHSPEQTVYEQLWQQSVAAFDRNTVPLDAFLTNRPADKRRGVTLVARPDATVCAEVKNFLDEIAGVAPGQHFYQLPEFHMTVLSIISGTESWRQAMQQLPNYLATLDEVLKVRPAFSVTFRGVTASPQAVMIQGFPIDNTLAQLRNDLRSALTARGLGENLDCRYKIVTAHLTVMRFAMPMNDWTPLKSLLAANRNRDFGTACFRTLQLIESDWYASTKTVQILREYPLGNK